MRVPGLVLLVSVAAALATTPQTREAPAPRRVLFIGNSLTAANNLLEVVESLSRARGSGAITTMAVTANNYSLEDHWNHGNAQAVIARGGWSVVVLQQGPSALPESRVLLRVYTKRFADEARKVGARAALYMVWPAKARAGDFAAVSESYGLAARDVDGLLLPAGGAWREASRHDPSLALYGSDGFHPSELGTYVAALAIWGGLSAQSVVGLPGPGGVSADTIRLVQDAADAAVAMASPPKGSAAPR